MNKKLFFAGLFVILSAALFFSSRENMNLSETNNLHLIIKKEAREVQVFDGEKLVKTYKMALGFAPRGDKKNEGDGKTPEGEFYIFTKNDESRFFFSLGVSYPGVKDAQRGLAENLISREEYDQIIKAAANKQMPPQKTNLGGEIYIHGGDANGDWTQGCIALKNEDMRELFEAISVGDAITILP